MLKITCLLCLLILQANAQDIFCSQEFCDEFGCDIANENVPEECHIQNVTHNGVFLPFPGPCNCCDYCLMNLAEGENCTVGEPGVAPSDRICGDYLTCRGFGDHTHSGSCVLISGTDPEEICLDKRTDFDERLEHGVVGDLELRPRCNRRGFYDRFKCIPGEICYCVGEDGERIFGEIPFSPIAERILNCGCSLQNKTMSEFIGRKLHVGEHMRCLPNGDYDPIQCMGDECFCVDTLDAVVTFPDNFETVNTTSVSNDTLPCFVIGFHEEYAYRRPCEEEYLNVLADISDVEALEMEALGALFPNCQLDGYYGAVQKNDTHAYCADINGDVLLYTDGDGAKLEYMLDLTDSVDQQLADSMNCFCARVEWLMNNSNGSDPTTIPSCCRNGNYKKQQCRRGFCRCVDENGNQIIAENESTCNADDCW